MAEAVPEAGAGPQGGSPSRGRWYRGPLGVAAGAGLAGVLALGGAGIAAAASGSGSSPGSNPGSNPSPSTAPAPPGHTFGHPGFGGLGGFGGRILHGQAVVSEPGGSTRTVDVQSGTASAVSSTSITVTSTDHFSQTYTVNPQTFVGAQRDGISTVSNGDTVSIVATDSSGTRTATSILDLTKLRPGAQAQVGAAPQGAFSPGPGSAQGT